MEIGKRQVLQVSRKTDLGYMLTTGRIEVFMHFRDTLGEDLEIGSDLDVFLFFDSKKRLCATQKESKISTDNYEFCEVVGHIKSGVFVDAGITKDFLVSNDDLPEVKSLWPVKGDQLLVTLKERDGALVAKPATRPILEHFCVAAEESDLNREFSGRVVKINYAGVNILTVEGILGFAHESMMRGKPRLGQVVEGKIIEVLENGEVYMNLIPQKETVIDKDAEQLLQYIKMRAGTITITDKSSPDEIFKELKMSKAAFKRAVGTLLKKKVIIQDKESKIIKLK